MKTKYIGIESIFITEKEFVTIACNIMLEGKNYDEPIYTNLFCSYEELQYFLNFDTTSLSKQILADIETQSIIADNKQIEIHLPPYINNEIEWKFGTMVDLKIAEEEEIPFECYVFSDIEREHFAQQINTYR